MKVNVHELIDRGCGIVSSLVEVAQELTRLQRIEAAARAHVATWDGGDTMVHDTRAALREALKEQDAPSS